MQKRLQRGYAQMNGYLPVGTTEPQNHKERTELENTKTNETCVQVP